MIRKDKNINLKCLPTVLTVGLNLFFGCLRDQAILIELKCPSEKGHAFTCTSKLDIKNFVYLQIQFHDVILFPRSAFNRMMRPMINKNSGRV
jgi:hypothetical protein